MKIKEININGFRSHLDTAIKGLSRFNIFLGPNGAGKSSVLDAISYALTGTCRGTDGGGKGADVLISQGLPEGSSIAIRLMTTKGEVFRPIGSGPKSAAQNKISQVVGVDHSMARTLVQSGHFMRLSPNDQKELVLSVTSKPLTVGEVRELVGDIYARVGAGIFQPDSLTTLDGVNAALKQATDLRPLIKRDLANCVYKGGEGEKLVEPGQDPEAVYADASARMKGLRDQRDQMVSTANQAAMARQGAVAHNAKVDVLKTELETINDRIVEAKDPDDLRAGIGQLVEQMERDEEAQEKANAGKADAWGRLCAIETKLNALRADYANLSKLGGECPTCTQEVSAEWVKGRLADLKKQAGVLEASKKKATVEYQAFGEVKNADTTALRAKQTALVDEIRQGENDIKQAAHIEASIKSFKLKNIPEAVAADTSEIDARIEKGDGILKRLTMEVSEHKRAMEVGGQRAKIEKRLAAVEELVLALGPKGPIREKLMGDGMVGFMEAVNGAAQACGLGPILVGIEPWRILYNGVPAVLASSSEEARISMCFAGVLAASSGLGIVCLDSAEMLDGQSRALLPALLDACKLDQAFIASVSDEPSGRAVADWSFYGVSKADGGASVVERLGEQVAA